MNFKERFFKSYELDVRSLSLMRIAIGLCALVDIIGRMGDLTAHYTDQGIFPRIYWVTESILPGNISFHGANGTWWFIAALFAVHFFIALAFTLGYRTKLSTIFLFIFTASLHNRNWLLNNGGDDIFRVMLFCCQFLPLGAYFSWDARENLKPQKMTITWLMGALYIIQLFCIYFFSALLKNHPIWYRDFTATYYALQLDFFVSPWAKWLSGHPDFLKFVTFVTIYLEWLVPILLLMNFIFGKYQAKFKTLVVFTYVFFHLGLVLMMDLGVFPWFCMGFWLALLPSEFWELKWIKKKFQFMRGGAVYKESHFKKALAVVFIFIVVGWNIEEMKPINTYSTALSKIGSILQVQQKWNMFAPYPKLINVWMEGNGYTESGEKIDVFNESEDFEGTIQKRFYSSIQNKQWRKFFLLMTESENYTKYYAEYICRKFNKLKTARLKKELKRVEFILYRQQTLLGYLKDREERFLLFAMECAN